ncbi:McrC family protein [Catenovulum agarivorans]|uniref:McrC family protein n=1 Tax=Catenovulum agarivorans TaxID=1172192 RepID=UPI0002EC5770|nr:McrC family protein [Catenovulum agarivorans]
MIKHHHVVYEFNYLTKEKVSGGDNFTQISATAFDYLVELCKCQESESRFLSNKRVGTIEVVQVKNYLGVIFTPDGTQIEVLPKTASRAQSDDGNADARAALLNMLATLADFKSIQSSTANIEQIQMPLLEVFISEFLASVNQLIKRGLRSDYVNKQDNLYFLKGKLLVNQQMKQNFINQHKFVVEYDEFEPDRPANRLLHSTLVKVKQFTRSLKNQKLLSELTFAFADIPLSQNIKNDFLQLKLDRGMQYYKAPLAWAKLILEGFSPLTTKGINHASSLLFRSEVLFESYVRHVLNQQIKTDDNKLIGQTREKSLVEHNGANYFNLQPDLVIQACSLELSKKSVTQVVLDTKWKLLDQNKNNGTDKYGLSQADFYQMFAYAQKYLNGHGTLVLIYPKQTDFEEPLQHSFDFTSDDNKQLKLWVVPFDISHNCDDNKRLLIQKGSGLDNYLNCAVPQPATNG